LILAENLTKIEAALELPAPSDGFRQSLITICWTFYENSLPEAEIKVSRSTRKKALRRAADLSNELTELVTRIWESGDCAVVAELHEFVSVSLPSKSIIDDRFLRHPEKKSLDDDKCPKLRRSAPMHRSGVGFVGALNEFAIIAGRLADGIPDDTGGDRPGFAFDRLLIGLGNYYREFVHARQRPLDDGQFFRFAATVTEMLRGLKTCALEVPPTDSALKRRLYRLNAKRRPVT